ncbi:hypothetical protein CEY12_09315 [Chryseobacterium sp. T16E-39]|uniref:hypothetical protein n=1 Tax=Chryseobacterium sp. T16E-39 TaxID=2015076 RepID=UPI000B5B3AE9|nr:hypothetical protein [Chryseobacterium sp. T16E-39]ASK30297.1 hypothetical protein CEY12_09315 [Chryseobacterium sp. T16E-39]
MTKKVLFSTLILLFGITNAQIGIGTPNPRGALDINKPTTNEHGLVLPTNSSTTNISNPSGGEVAIGTIIYDSAADCVKVYKSTGWSNCLCDTCDGTTIVPLSTLDCSRGALTGTYIQGTQSTGTKIINYTGGSGQAYGAIHIASTGVTGLSATAPAGTFATGNGNITLEISGTPNKSGTASFKVTLGGQTCTFIITVQPKIARRINILSLTPDNWASNLSSDSYTSVARSKLNNSSHFGPSGDVKIEGFNYKTINVSQSSDQAFNDAIDNADIIWVGYITNSTFPQSKRNILAQKITEKKKFFYLGADGGTAFFPFSNFAGYSFTSTPNNKNGKISATNVGPTNGIFGNIPVGSTIVFNRYVGGISFPSTASSFMDTENGRPTGIIDDNLIIIGDINWYINRDSRDGFINGTSSCTQNNNSILFCNIFEKAIEYVLTH